MAKSGRNKPTDAELAILRVLWDRGPSTVRDVHEALGAGRGAGYTTTLKLMQIMRDKGLVRRDEASRSHVYRSAVDEGRTLGGILRDLTARAFGGSARKLIVQALASGDISAAELRQIRKLLADYREKDHGRH